MRRIAPPLSAVGARCHRRLGCREAVGVQTVFNSYFGVVLPIFIAAIVGRLFWPVLRQAELRKRFIEFFSTCSHFLTKQPGHGDDALSDRLTLIPIESVRGFP